MSQNEYIEVASDFDQDEIDRHEEVVKRGNLFVTFFENGREFLANSLEEHVGAFSAQTAFFLFLSIFPFLAVLLSLAQFLPVSYEEISAFIVDNCPIHFQGIILQIFNDIYHGSTKTSTIVSLFMALWSSAKAMLSVKNCLDEIYRARDRRNYFFKRILSMFYTLVMVGIMMLMIFLNIFGKKILSFINSKITVVDESTWQVFNLRMPITFIIMFILMLMLYSFTPNRKLKLRRQIPGALLASVGWVLVSKVFTLVIHFYYDFSKVYGSLSSVVLVMLWVYILAWILYIGAMLNEFIYEYFIYPKKYLRPYTRDRYYQNLKSDNPAYTKVLKYTKEKLKHEKEEIIESIHDH